MKKIKTLGAAAIALLTTTACSNEDNINNEVDNTGKTRIALSAGDDNTIMTSRAGFTVKTRIVARIVSEKRDNSETKCVKTNLQAAAVESGAEYSNVSYVTGNVRYWDDAHGRNSRLSVFAIAIPNQYADEDGNKLDGCTIKGTDTWATANAEDNKITWSVKNSQAYADLAAEDLTYSNNIQESGNYGVYTWDYTANKYPDPAFATDHMNASRHDYNDGATKYDGRLYFTQKSKTIKDAVTDDPGHFDKGHLEFKHALSRIQVNLIKGEGYSSTFNVTNMQVLGQSNSGTFDIKTASWTNSSTATAINMANWATAEGGYAATYEAQMLPGYVFADDETNVLQLTVDDNTYFIQNKQLHKALSDNSITDFTTLMGNRYKFNITVAKNKITNITATIVDWNNIEAANKEVNNSHLTFSFYSNGNPCTDVKLFKYEQDLGKAYIDNTYTANPVAGSAYTEVTSLTIKNGNTYTTSEFYTDNKTAYHFRSTNVATSLDSENKTFTMTSGSEESYDYHWGAPMKTGLSKLEYKSNGYLECIDKGIVAASTESTINLTEIHMMSQLEIKLTTVTGDAAVTLGGATVKLTRISNSGTVDMGSGFINPGEVQANSSELSVTETSGVYSCTLYVVPQSLKRGDSDADYIGITIKTVDNNEYYIVKRLSEIKANSVGSEVTHMQTANDYITQWYPGHKYIYTFNLSKTEITNITATIVGWQNVTAGSTDLDLEK